MVKLTPELIGGAHQYLNPLKDRELDLRGYKIPILENLGATLDQFDVIDFSDNEVRKIDGFPLLKRLKCLLFNNNRIVRIAPGLGESLPNLQALILTNNHLQDLSDLEHLASLKSLETVSLLHNPVVHKTHYRLYLINLLPNLRILDFRKVKKVERDEAAKLFKSKKGKEMKKSIEMRAKTFVPGEDVEAVEAPPARKPVGAASAEEMKKIREAIANASSLEEVERLNQMLQRGQVPVAANTNGDRNGGEMETD